MEVDARLTADETLVPDARAGVSPSQMVDRKLLAALGCRPEAQDDSDRENLLRLPARASEN